MSPISKRQITGQAGEDAAATFLEKMGYAILARNYRAGRGEIDIIAKDGETLVFVEVKAGRSGKFGSPEERVTVYKQRQIARIASLYLEETKQGNLLCRFDVIAVDVEFGRQQIRHIKDAFWMEDDGFES